MPPKGKPTKNEVKAKTKSADDKTFGLKNKNKSTKVGKYVQQVKEQAATIGNPKLKKEEEDRKAQIANKKAAEAAKKAELAELFKVVQVQQKVPFGVDPKTILCAFFKNGTCQKGSKCKFSHDMNIERKATKADLYTDARDEEKDQTMETWDQAKLEDAVNKKGAIDNRNKPTDIVCKYFLEAIDSRKYGWFWECPNGGKDCKYRHALPPGFVLKKKETTEERLAREEMEKENQISIEDFLETERHKLGSNTTPVTATSFAAWKADRKQREAAEQESESKRKKEAYDKYKAGMKTGMAFSGKELFDFNPDWAVGDEDEDAMDEYIRGESDHEEENAAAASPSADADAAVGVDENLFEEEMEGLEDDDE
ncbi:uncharacterized protein EV422DRAFT_47391 [Fimicolochytrium jonesii]|uniref:uncharacterized protein n=1 Tax=Fimicolochytrium jonesii TaxID=1396493 RepID=UPI0022FF0A7A|nr:uncharacterized protein EV422DRAFT_47391 [Fimicolochytrium jonesii]KAI8820960.1 hypothetical protein EV422DRAFT_47391 [Fimicolochytrium jonesii]